MDVKLLNHMGDDLSVVNAARVSFDKESSWEDEALCPTDPVTGGKVPPYNRLKERDERLINYLARHKHWTPFGHTAATFRIKAPIFVARQLQKHTVGLVWNEISRRYVDNKPEFYTPDVWRKRADNVKQGSSDEPVSNDNFGMEFAIIGANRLSDAVERHNNSVYELYTRMLEHGVCPEQARMVLPQSMYTEWWWTGNVASFARVCKLRLDPHAQKETQYIAQMISDEMEKLFPVSWKALMSVKLEKVDPTRVRIIREN